LYHSTELQIAYTDMQSQTTSDGCQNTGKMPVPPLAALYCKRRLEEHGQAQARSTRAVYNARSFRKPFVAEVVQVMAIRASNLLLCNYVYEDPLSFNVTLLGIFTSLRATRFPTPYRSMMAYTLLIGDPGQYGELRLQCISETTGEVCHEQSARVQIGVRGQWHVRFWLDEIQFPAPGQYRFLLMFENDEIAELTIPIEDQ
jgi:hypothetical protein